MDDTLRTCHPAVSFAYFALVIACAMLLMHPVCLVLSTLGGGWYVARLLGGKGLRRHLLWLLPMALLAAALNPAFVHQGVTILAYLPSGNPLTLESLLYGLAAGAMLSAVALWFVCVTDVITSDKVVYLFGRVIPALSLLLSMILRFVPHFVRRLRAVAQAQRHLGRDTQTGAPAQRVRSALRVFSIVVTWSLESGLITADSMRCRGYGLPGRTSFSLYRFDRRDGAVALWLAFCGLYLLGGGLAGGAALLKQYAGADEEKKKIIAEIFRRLAVDVKDELKKAAGEGLEGVKKAAGEGLEGVKTVLTNLTKGEK